MTEKEANEKLDELKANIHGELSPDSTIYRIFRTKWLLEDLRKQVITLINPCGETQGDWNENILKYMPFLVDNERHAIFKQVMAEYYCQSWSLTKPDWGMFGWDDDTILVSTTVEKIFSRLVDPKDKYWSLKYHISSINYADSAETRKVLEETDIAELLTPQGFDLLETILTLDEGFAPENEVRLVYIGSPQNENETPTQHELFDEDLKCRHAFDWSGIIDESVLNPNNMVQHDELIQEINKTKM